MTRPPRKSVALNGVPGHGTLRVLPGAASARFEGEVTIDLRELGDERKAFASDRAEYEGYVQSAAGGYRYCTVEVVIERRRTSGDLLILTLAGDA